MLDAYIIDAIRRKERERDERGRVWLELPLERPDVDHRPPPPAGPEEEPNSSIVILPWHDDDDDDDSDTSEAA